MTVPVDDLRAAGLEGVFEALERAVADHAAGESANVAVVSDPFGGREALLDYAEETLEGSAERISLSATASQATEPTLPDAEVVIIDDCQYLYRRQIGGFDVLDRVIERMAMSETLFITSWNRYAWRYLSRVRNVDRSFPVVVEIPELDAGGIERLVTARYGPDLPEFVSTGEAGRIKTLLVNWRGVEVAGRTIPVPTVKPNTAWVTSWWTTDDEESIEAVVYEKVRRVSNGNPGIATSVWEEALDAGDPGAVAPAYVRDLDVEFDLSDEQALLLLVVVSTERVRLDTLADVAPDVQVETALGPLVDRGILATEGNEVWITPAGLAPAVEALRRRRLLW